MNRRLRLAIAPICVAACASAALPTLAAEAQGMARPEFLPPDVLIAEVLDAHPMVAEAEGRLAAARGEARQLSTGEHETTLSTTYDTRRVRGAGDFGEWSAQLSRGVRLPGKGVLDAAAGAAGIRAASDGVEDARHQASLELADRWIQWLAATELARIDADEAESFERELKALARRVELQDAAPLDLQQVQAAAARARAAAAVSAGAERTMRAELESLFPRIVPARAPALSTPATPVRPFADWRDLVLRRSHEITIAEAEAEKARALARRARLDRAPDPSVGIRTFNERGGDETGVGIFVSIPFSGPRRSAIADRQQGLATEAEARRAGVVREVTRRAVSDVSGAESALAAWREADIARTAQAAAAVRIRRAYDLGERDLSDRLAADRQSYDARRQELQARAEAQQRLIRLALDAHELWLSEP